MAGSKSVPSPAVSQALAILRLLGREAEPLGVTMIARRLAISPSSCFNLLKTLHAEDMVEFDEATKRYRLGLGPVDIARMALRSDAVVPLARTVMQALAERQDAAIGLWRTMSADRLTLIALAESESATRIHMTVGQRQPIGSGATGRAVLAASGADDAVLARAHGEVRWPRPLTLDQYLGQVAEARAKGYAVDREWLNPGITTVAAAIPNPDGPVRYGLSCSAFSGMLGSEAIASLGRQMAEYALRIARQAYGEAV
ncbi:MAG: IclR family transcriptional regulator [Blastomonas sp.]